jgi:hypothetical protein
MTEMTFFNPERANLLPYSENTHSTATLKCLECSPRISILFHQYRF